MSSPLVANALRDGTGPEMTFLEIGSNSRGAGMVSKLSRSERSCFCEVEGGREDWTACVEVDELESLPSPPLPEGNDEPLGRCLPVFLAEMCLA